MKKSVITSISIGLLFPALSSAGVVMDMVTRNPAGQETERSTIYAQSNLIRMDELEGGQAVSSMIFLGDEFLFLDHKRKSYMVMDEAMLGDVADMVSEAMKQMEAELARMPPEQRAMVEQMMKGEMQGMSGQKADPRTAPRVEKMGSGRWQSSSCRQYAVFEGGEKTQEICAAHLDEIEGADEIMDAFRSMAAYITKLTESMPMMAEDGINPGELMDQIDGFPVIMTDYENGVATSKTSVDAVADEDLEPDLFAAPEGYDREDPLGQR